MKKGPLTNKDKTHIEKFYQQKTAAQLARTLDRSIDTVQKFIDSLTTKLKQEEQAEESKQEDTHIMSMMARRKDYGVVVMTENASMASDEARKNHKAAPSGRYKTCIHTFKKETE